MKNLLLPIDEELLPYAYWLCNIKGVGRKTIYHLLTQIKSPKTVYDLSEKELLPFLTERQRKLGLAERLISSKGTWDVQENYQKLTEKHIYFTCLGHVAYPERLANIPDAPYGLYYIGRLPEHDKPSVAIIGARNCSEYGRYMAECYGRELAAAGVQIISGMARGIDGIGQKEALLTGGYSLGVMGCSVDICYPEENRELYNMLCAHGGICSEYSLNTEPQNTLFPPRNRIISAFSDIVLVIEARHRSGTLITVDMALEQGKEVYALPGRVTDPLSDGCNRLIQQGAGIAVSPQDMLRTLMGNGFKLSGAVSGEKQHSAGKNMFLSAVQSEIMDVLDSSPLSVEIIKQHMLSKHHRDIPIPELMNQLMKLSLCGAVRQVSNSYFMKE
ncbi:MAG: DNA-processing protein DprA [Lachnospiraceae bacterium]|nr:DNA-processing protein DprA [Lachnospiraceae bacterium]